MIQVDGLTKYYGNFKALDNVSFFVERGEIVGFLGPNGAGKTTTMRILTGYLPPSEGQVSVAGYDVFDEPLKVRERLGYLPETVPLYQEMSVWDYLSYMAELHHLENREDHVAEVLDMVDLADRADSLVSSLSKGMKQRVGLAQALVHQPDVLILDEPTIGLDPGQIIEVRDLVRQIGQDRTVMLSTHILSEVSALCGRVVIIDEGRIVADDTPDNLSALLEGTTRFLVNVDSSANRETVAQEIRGLDGVQAVDASESGLRVTSAEGQDARAVVSRAIVNKGWDLLELSPLQLPLEEIFLQLTEDEDDLHEMAGEEA